MKLFTVMEYRLSLKINICQDCFTYFQKNFIKNFRWKYFSTTHGKSVIDGGEVRVKSLIRMKVLSKSEITNVQNSLDFANVATSLMTNNTALHMSQIYIEFAISFDNSWANVEDIVGIKKMHVIKCNLQNKKIQL